jgi:hypothetical protein
VIEIRVPSLPQALAARKPRDELVLNSLDARIGGSVHPTAWPAGPYQRLYEGPAERDWMSPTDEAAMLELESQFGRHA